MAGGGAERDGTHQKGASPSWRPWRPEATSDSIAPDTVEALGTRQHQHGGQELQARGEGLCCPSRAPAFTLGGLCPGEGTAARLWFCVPEEGA